MSGGPRTRRSVVAEKISVSKVDQKAETRSRLRMAALTLFATKGYDDTPVSDITALAGVSDRPFFLHFPTKADAVMDLAEGRLVGPFLDSVFCSKSGVSDLGVLEDAFIAWIEAAGDRREVHRRAQLVLRAAAMSPTVRGKMLEATDVMVVSATAALARRRKLTAPTLEVEVAVAAAVGLVERITAEWVARDTPHDLHSIARAHFEAFRRVAEADRKARHA
jgi:AcrR family transcriptional regulator